MYRGINPNNASEGNNVTSNWGAAFRNAIARMWSDTPKHQTILPRANLMYPAFVGIVRNPATIRPSLPYINNSIPGPIALDAGEKSNKE